MLTLDYDKLNKHLICKHSGELYSSFDGMGLDEIKKMLKWFPKK
jgi:hypothetical protein